MGKCTSEDLVKTVLVNYFRLLRVVEKAFLKFSGEISVKEVSSLDNSEAVEQFVKLITEGGRLNAFEEPTYFEDKSTREFMALFKLLKDRNVLPEALVILYEDEKVRNFTDEKFNEYVSFLRDTLSDSKKINSYKRVRQ